MNNGQWTDLGANFTFPSESVITRYRWFGGFKLKLSAVFLDAELDVTQHGTSNDSNGDVTDGSGTQLSFSLAAGLDFLTSRSRRAKRGFAARSSSREVRNPSRVPNSIVRRRRRRSTRSLRGRRRCATAGSRPRAVRWSRACRPG